MKVLIWIGCVFAIAIVQTFFIMNGVRLGAIPMVLLFLAGTKSAKALCKKWDGRR